MHALRACIPLFWFSMRSQKAHTGGAFLKVPRRFKALCLSYAFKVLQGF